MMFHGHTWHEGMGHAEQLLKAATGTKAHPMAPKDRSTRLCKIHKSMIHGESTATKHQNGINASGDIEDAATAEKLMSVFQPNLKNRD